MSSTAPQLRRDAQLGRKLCVKCGGNLPKRSDVKGEYHKPYPFKTCPFCREDAQVSRTLERVTAEKAVREYDNAVSAPPVRVIREVQLEGRVYEVVFDGT